MSMPTALRLDPYRFYFYSYDCDEPRHMHIDRGRQEMNGTPFAVTTPALSKIVSVAVTDDTLSVDLEDGRTISIPIGWYPRLAYGTEEERSDFEISGAGYAIHWPDLDEDIGIEGVLLGKKSTESRASFQRWLQKRR